MTKPKLKPCPFCGKKAKVELTFNLKEWYKVGCKTCGCGTLWEATKNEAVYCWNKRIQGENK